MDAIAKGFGLIVPMPRYSDSQLGKVVYIDEGGVVRSIGSVFDDSHFQKLLGVSSTPLDHVINEENHPSLTVAFTTGSMEIKPLSEEECSAYVSFLFRVDKRSFILDSLNRPVSTESRPSCGWLITRSTSVNRAGDAIILGPNLRKTWLNIQEDLVAKWVKDAPRKSTLWTSKGRKRLPKLLVVLEEWTCPSWTRISWGENDNGPAAVGLLTTNATNAPMWRFLAMPEETMTSFRVGNTQVYTVQTINSNHRKSNRGLYLLLEFHWTQIPISLNKGIYGFGQEFADSSV